ncbi:MAG: acetyl-CoA synthetase [Oceanospirillaceae bacterium]|jgi:acetyl-CoA synthetase
MLIHNKNYQQLYDSFQADFPHDYNIGVDVCDKWYYKSPEKLAIIHKRDDGSVKNYSFADLYHQSNAICNLLIDDGFIYGDAVAILLPQSPEVAFGHIATYKLGGIAIPLFALFGEQAIKFRLQNSGAKFVITNRESARKIATMLNELPDLEKIYCIDGDEDGCESLYQRLKGISTEYTPVKTTLDTPAVIIYTSGTTGQPKGALHCHKILLGHLPGVEMSHNFFPQEDDLIWTPADWAWIGGLYDVLMPALHHGVPVVCHRFRKFIPEKVFALISELSIKNMFLPPTAIKMLSTVESPQKRWKFAVRTIASGGESLGKSLHQWGKDTFDLTINEFYGQTECNMVISSCSEIMNTPVGYMGKAVPGHTVEIIDDSGNILPANQIGNIAVYNDSPSKFLYYWKNNSESTKKYIGNWLVTGDCGSKNEAGFIKFFARDDDVITSSGYRIGPGEIEDCLLMHESIKMSAVIGKPDATRTEIVKAFVVLNEQFQPSLALKLEIMDFVKTKLSAHEYPREVEFIDELPMTTTGKIIRKQLPR